MMSQRNVDRFDPTLSTRGDDPVGDVPQEHTPHTTCANPSARDWSQLGRRVLAEAWRRTTDELADRQRPDAMPAVPAPHLREQR
jgi:hypothetical protein